MRLVVLAVMLATTLAQTEIDKDTIIGIFGTPPTVPSRGDLGDITVRPTTAPVTLTDKNGQKCQCVPYYLCNNKNEGVDINNPNITGWGELDIRFGENDCQESIEICCTAPKPPSEVSRPKPNANNLKGCGYRNPRGLGVTITGGTGAESQFGEFPWVVALINASNGSLIGVGSLIHPQVVITGAHVVSKYVPGGLIIRAGEWDTQTIKELYDFQERNIREMYIHPEFNSKSLKNDVALLHLDKPVQLADHINMICLADQDEVFETAKSCVANGWGKYKFGQKNLYAVILKKLELDIVEHGYCNTLLQRTRLGSRFNLHSSFLCAGGEDGKDTCTGDGGAPLACPIGGDRYKLTGIVAWGIGCGQKNVPGVYASIPALRCWVDGIMNSLGYGISTYSI